MFDDQVPTIPPNSKPYDGPLGKDFVPQTSEKVGERPYKNKLEERISRKIKDKIFGALRGDIDFMK